MVVFRKGRIGARVQKGAYWCLCLERGVLVLVFRKGRIGACVQKGAYWCLCSERGVLVLVQKRYLNCRSQPQGDFGTQATPLKSLVGKSIGRKCILTLISHKYLNIPCLILLRSKTCVSASASQYHDNIYGDKFGTGPTNELKTHYKDGNLFVL